MGRSIIRDTVNGAILVVSPRLDPSTNGKQEFFVENGGWYGSIKDGKCTYNKNLCEIRNDFEDSGCYNEVSNKFEESLK